MSLDARPNPLRVLAERKALWLAVPAIALLAGLVMIGSWSVTPPKVVAQAQPASAPTARPFPGRSGHDCSAQARDAGDVLCRAEAGARKDHQELPRLQSGGLPRGADRARSQDGEGAGGEAEGRHRRERRARSIAIPTADIAGNPNGDITVVEFFDYNCGYCKRGLHDVIKLVESDPKVRVVFKELPILSKGSEEASRVAIAAGRQGKYWDMHKAMLEAKGQMNEANGAADRHQARPRH